MSLDRFVPVSNHIRQNSRTIEIGKTRSSLIIRCRCLEWSEGGSGPMTSLVTEKWLVLRSYLLIIPPTGTAITPQDFSVRDNPLILGTTNYFDFQSLGNPKFHASHGTKKMPAFEPMLILYRVTKLSLSASTIWVMWCLSAMNVQCDWFGQTAWY